MIYDYNKGITQITYNHLNLPVKITFGTTGEIEYLYNAAGRKITKHVEDFVNQKDDITTYMSGGFQYKNGNMQLFPHAEGYVNTTRFRGGYMYNYVFNYTDHLGNIRLSYAFDSSTGNIKVLEENHYYPFGLKHTNYNSDYRQFILSEEQDIALLSIPNTSIPTAEYTDYKYKYNGKELQDELGLNMYDYGARNYDAAIGRWMNIDPLAEVSRRWSPYTYCYNNPIVFVDPDGMLANPFDDPIYNSGGQQIGDDGKDNGKIHIVFDLNTELEIFNQTSNGNKSIDLTNKEHVTLNGGRKTVNGVLESYEAQFKDTSQGARDKELHEEGGHTKVNSNGVVEIVHWAPGSKRTPGNNATVPLFNGTIATSNDGILDYWHIHPSGTTYGTDSNGNSISTKSAIGPSGVKQFGKPMPIAGDIPNQRALERKGINATAIQVDTVNKSNNVNFYNSAGKINTMSLNNFKKLW